MGEIADGLINGDFDYCTGEYIGTGFGYPRTNNKSLSWEKNLKPLKSGKIDYKHSKHVAFKAIKRYLKKRFKITDITDTVNAYMPQTDKSLKQKCLLIQDDFVAFVKWMNENNKK